MRKKILSFVLSLAMVLAMVPFLPATVYATTTPDIYIDGITPVAGETPATIYDDFTYSSDYQLNSITWYTDYGDKVDPYTDKFQPGVDYYVVLTFTGEDTLDAYEAEITIDGHRFIEGEDDCYATAKGNTIQYECWFYNIKVPYFAINIVGEPGDNIVTSDPSYVFKMKKFNGAKTVTYKWWKCDKNGNTSGNSIYSNTTGKFTMKNLGWNQGLHYVAVKAYYKKDGKKVWSNKVVLKFKIYYDLNDATITVKNRTYNGDTGRTPDITIKAKINGVTKTLKKGTDYTLSYSKSAANRKNVGKYYFMIDGKGYYYYSYDDDTDGEFDYYDRAFKINPKGTTIKSVSPGSRKLTVKWNKQSDKMSASRISGYQVQRATNKSFTSNKRTYKVKGYSNTSKTIKDLKGGKKYYVRVRTYKIVNGFYCYSKWSPVKSVTTKY